MKTCPSFWHHLPASYEGIWTLIPLQEALQKSFSHQRIKSGHLEMAQDPLGQNNRMPRRVWGSPMGGLGHWQDFGEVWCTFYICWISTLCEALGWTKLNKPCPLFKSSECNHTEVRADQHTRWAVLKVNPGL